MALDMYPGPVYGGYSSPRTLGTMRKTVGNECPGNLATGYISRPISDIHPPSPISHPPPKNRAEISAKLFTKTPFSAYNRSVAGGTRACAELITTKTKPKGGSAMRTMLMHNMPVGLMPGGKILKPRFGRVRI